MRARHPLTPLAVLVVAVAMAGCATTAEETPDAEPSPLAEGHAVRTVLEPMPDDPAPDEAPGDDVRVVEPGEAPSPPPSSPRPVPPFPMADGESPVPGPVERLFQTEAEWLAFWGEAGAPEAWQRPRWEAHDVALVILGERPNDCHRVEFERFVHDPADNVTTLHYVEVVPAEGVRCNEGPTHPFAAWFFDPQERVAFESRTRETSVGTPGPELPVAHEVVEATYNVTTERRADLRVFEEEREWAAFWSAHAPPDSPRPQVDFSERRVAVVLLPDGETTCHRLRLDNVTRDANLDDVALHLTRFTGAPDAACGAAMVRLQLTVVLERGGPVGYWMTTVEA